MRTCLIVLIGVCWFVAFAGEVHAADVEIYPADNLRIDSVMYRKLVFVRANKEKFKGLTGFLLSRKLGGDNTAPWSITVRGEEKGVAAASWCSTLRDQVYTALWRDYINRMPLLEVGLPWHLTEAPSESELRKALESKNIDYAIHPAFSATLAPNMTLSRLIDQELGWCDTEIVWAATQEKFRTYGISKHPSPSAAVTMEGNKEQGVKPGPSTPKSSASVSELEVERTKLQEAVLKQDIYINKLRSSNEAFERENTILQTRINSLEAKLNNQQIRRDGNIFRGYLSSETWIDIFNFLRILGFISLICLIYAMIVIYKKGEENHRSITSIMRSVENYLKGGKQLEARLNLYLNVYDKIKQIIEKSQKSTSDILDYSTVSSEDEESLRYQKSKLSEVHKKFSERDIQKETNIHKQRTGTDDVHERIVQSLPILSSAVDYVHNSISVFSTVLNKSQQEIKNLRDEKKRLEESEKSKNTKIVDLQNRIEEAYLNAIMLKKSRMVYDGFLNKAYPTSFRLNGTSLNHLRERQLPDAILQRLGALKDQEMCTEDEFMAAVRGEIGNDAANRYKELILCYACPKIDIYWEKYNSLGDRYIVEFTSRLVALREFLQKYESREVLLPNYYNACGIRDIFINLDTRKSYHGPFFIGEDYAKLTIQKVQDYLLGEFDHYWGRIFRAVLLIETYFSGPNSSDAGLLNELEHTKNLIQYVLHRYGIRPHKIHLLNKNNNDREDEIQAENDSSSPIPSELKNHDRFRDKVRPLSRINSVPCDVRVWGYDVYDNIERHDELNVPSKPIKRIPSKLIVKAPGEGW